MNFLFKATAVALFAGLTMTSCKKNEPRKETQQTQTAPKPYLVGKVFQSGTTPEQSPNEYSYSLMTFESENKVIIKIHDLEKVFDQTTIGESTIEANYTYADNKLVITITKSGIKITTNDKTETLDEHPDRDLAVGKTLTFIVNEAEHTIQYKDGQDAEKKIIFRLKK